MERTIVLKNGETLVLRPPVPEDAAAAKDYLAIVGAETDYLYLDSDGIPGLTIEGEREYLLSSIADPRIAMYLGFVGNRPVAMFDLRPDGNRPRIAHNGTLALSIVKDYWHMGIGTLAMEMLLDAGKKLGYRTLHLAVNAENERAVRLYERFGFERVGLHRGYTFVSGRYMDQLLMDRML